MAQIIREKGALVAQQEQATTDSIPIHGLPDISYLPTTCDCVNTASSEDVSTASTSTSTIILVVIIIIVMIAVVGGGVYYYKKKLQQSPSHVALAEATQESEMGIM